VLLLLLLVLLLVLLLLLLLLLCCCWKTGVGEAMHSKPFAVLVSAFPEPCLGHSHPSPPWDRIFLS
jgi:hypothetical protein